MEYQFNIYKSLTGSIWFYISIKDPKYYTLAILGGTFSTTVILEHLMEGIESTKDSFNDFKFQTEGDDLYIYSNSYGVQFFDLKSVKKEVDLVLSHDVFLDFLNDFKTFVAENS